MTKNYDEMIPGLRAEAQSRINLLRQLAQCNHPSWSKLKEKDGVCSQHRMIPELSDEIETVRGYYTIHKPVQVVGSVLIDASHRIEWDDMCNTCITLLRSPAHEDPLPQQQQQQVHPCTVQIDYYMTRRVAVISPREFMYCLASQYCPDDGSFVSVSWSIDAAAPHLGKKHEDLTRAVIYLSGMVVQPLPSDPQQACTVTYVGCTDPKKIPNGIVNKTAAKGCQLLKTLNKYCMTNANVTAMMNGNSSHHNNTNANANANAAAGCGNGANSNATANVQEINA
jgi:hypothetical protein